MSDSNTGARCKCRCGARLFWLAAAVLVVLIVLFAQSCARERRPAPPAPPAPEEPARPMTAGERIDERVADTNYMADLDGVADRYGKLGALRAEAAKEFDAWRSDFLAANPEARELAAKLAEARAAAAEDAEALEARLKELFAKDGKGAALLDKIEKIGASVEENRRAAADYIGSRLRQQTASGSPPPAPAQ